MDLFRRTPEVTSATLFESFVPICLSHQCHCTYYLVNGVTLMGPRLELQLLVTCLSSIFFLCYDSARSVSSVSCVQGAHRVGILHMEEHLMHVLMAFFTVMKELEPMEWVSRVCRARCPDSAPRRCVQGGDSPDVLKRFD